MLGMESLNQKYKGLEVNFMAHQVLGVAFMLEKERNKKFRGGILADAMGLGKVSHTQMARNADLRYVDYSDAWCACW